MLKKIFALSLCTITYAINANPLFKIISFTPKAAAMIARPVYTKMQQEVKESPLLMAGGAVTGAVIAHTYNNDDDEKSFFEQTQTIAQGAGIGALSALAIKKRTYLKNGMLSSATFVKNKSTQLSSINELHKKAKENTIPLVGGAVVGGALAHTYANNDDEKSVTAQALTIAAGAAVGAGTAVAIKNRRGMLKDIQFKVTDIQTTLHAFRKESLEKLNSILTNLNEFKTATTANFSNLWKELGTLKQDVSTIKKTVETIRTTQVNQSGQLDTIENNTKNILKALGDTTNTTPSNNSKTFLNKFFQ